MNAEYYALFSLTSLFIYCFGLVSLFIKSRLFLSESFVAVIFGICIRPFVQNLFKDNAMNEFMIQLSRVVISLQVVAVGITVPKSYIWKEKISLLVVLVPIMSMTYAASALMAYYVLNLPWRTAFLIGACVTPTDPVLAAAILKGKFADKHIPMHLRNLLVIESAANDGLGYLLLQLPLLGHCLTTRDFIFNNVCCEILLACVIGALIGYGAKVLLHFSKRNGLIDKESFLVSMIAMGFFVTGVCAYVGYDEILACFICGIIFSRETSFIPEIKESHLMECVDALFNHLFFIIFGIMLESKLFTFNYLLFAILIIVFRRLPFFFIFQSFVPQLFNVQEVFFAGWFGPIGVGALFFAYHALHVIPKDNSLPGIENLLPIVKISIFMSIMIHGITVPVLQYSLKKTKGVEEYITESNCLVEEESNDSF